MNLTCILVFTCGAYYDIVVVSHPYDIYTREKMRREREQKQNGSRTRSRTRARTRGRTEEERQLKQQEVLFGQFWTYWINSEL